MIRTHVQNCPIVYIVSCPVLQCAGQRLHLTFSRYKYTFGHLPQNKQKANPKCSNFKPDKRTHKKKLPMIRQKVQ